MTTRRRGSNSGSIIKWPQKVAHRRLREWYIWKEAN
uniref:Uncharacterized protein n=1 Tax=Arundo donax TaxID=35708 RepID=A0A0A9EFC9_ARUDO